MNPLTFAKTRYTTKAFDPTRKIPQASIDELLSVVRHSPSSVNSQPWHFVVAGSDAGKALIAKQLEGAFAYNEPKVRQASHVVVLCTRTDMTDAHLNAVLEQEQQDGRFASPEARTGQQNTRQHYVNLHRFEQKDLQHWMEKQTYLALGALLLAASAMGIDATPMEGFNASKIDEALGLRAKGFTSLVLVGLGYRADSDFNAGLPKSRLTEESVTTVL